MSAGRGQFPAGGKVGSRAPANEGEGSMPTLWPEDLHHDMIGARHGGLVAQPRTRLAAERGQGAKAVSRSDGRGKLNVRRNVRQRRGDASLLYLQSGKGTPNPIG